jgi:hypothetical protein
MRTTTLGQPLSRVRFPSPAGVAVIRTAANGADADMNDTPQQQQERPHPASEIPDADTGTEDESSYPGDEDIEPDEEPDAEPDPAFDDPPGTRVR